MTSPGKDLIRLGTLAVPDSSERDFYIFLANMLNEECLVIICRVPIAIVHLLASSWAEFHGNLGRYLGPHGKLGYSSAGIRSL